MRSCLPGMVAIGTLAVVYSSSAWNGERTATATATAPRSPKPTISAPNIGPASELPSLLIPVAGVTAASLRNTFNDGRPGHRHEAIDIGAPRGTKVLAATDGSLVKLFTSVPGGLTIYQFDLDRRHAYYYAHLDHYASGVREGMPLHRGDVIGYVGTTGNAPEGAPHLHFAVFKLGAEQQWWKGEALNPFTALQPHP